MAETILKRPLANGLETDLVSSPSLSRRLQILYPPPSPVDLSTTAIIQVENIVAKMGRLERKMI